MFYDNFIKICIDRGIKPSVALENAGIDKSAGSRWKKGKSPTDTTVQKLADYFGISKSELLGQKDSPPPEGNGLTQEFSRIFDELSPQNKTEIIAEMLRRKRQQL